jgi:hypothetical protein
MQKHILSKSTFIKGQQCEKALYYHKHNREWRDDLSAAQVAIFAQGTAVGELAQQLFPGGVDCSPESAYDFRAAVLRTKEEIEKGTAIIYEAAFQFDGVLAALDILVKQPDGWRAYEVKSSTSVSETYELDAAIQYYTIVNSGIDLKDISIVHINNQYVKDGPLDITQLFAIQSVKESVLKLVNDIPQKVNKLKQVLQQAQAPVVDIGPHCSTPYQCDFAGHCWKHIPSYSVFNISDLRTKKKFDLYQKKVLHFKDIPEDYPLNEAQWKQVNCELQNKEHIDKPAIRSFVKGLNYPIHYLDFETFATAIPVFDGSRPYQQLVFQYSLHIEHENGVIEHKAYLAKTDGSDPRISFIQQLVADCATQGDILVYNIGFERGKLEDLKKYAPSYSAQIQGLIHRLKDLMVPFAQQLFYRPQMKGSYSIKYVLPALVPELSYADLNIKEGGTASNTFAQMILGKFNGNEDQARKDLLDYCQLDTWAMVKILEVLKKV